MYSAKSDAILKDKIGSPAQLGKFSGPLHV
jgi:hypothetical protein